MKHCTHCGNKLNEKDGFCSNCGKAIGKKEPEVVEDNHPVGVNQKDLGAAEKKETKPDATQPVKKKSTKMTYIGLILVAVIVAFMMFVLPDMNNNDATEDIVAEGDDQVEASHSEEEEIDLDSVDLTGT